MNYMPYDIVLYIYDFVDEYYLSYYNAFHQFFTHKYECNLYVLNQYYKKPSIVYIYTTFTGKSIERLYDILLYFNTKHKHHITIRKSVYIINKHLKKHLKKYKGYIGIYIYTICLVYIGLKKMILNMNQSVDYI
jgi:sporulation protein YlmC with PRC-barrel domain